MMLAEKMSKNGTKGVCPQLYHFALATLLKAFFLCSEFSL